MWASDKNRAIPLLTPKAIEVYISYMSKAWNPEQISDSRRRSKSTGKDRTLALDYPNVKTFRSPMRDVDCVTNRRRMLVAESNGRRILLRMRVDLYGAYKGKARYATLHRTAVVISCKDTEQAEQTLVSIIQMTMNLSDLDLSNRSLRFESLDLPE